MSTPQKIFIRWFALIAGTLITASVIGLVTMYKVVGTNTSMVKINSKEIEEVREYHRQDMQIVQLTVQDIRTNQKIIQADIKILLSRGN
jgi:hypothetical protein